MRLLVHPRMWSLNHNEFDTPGLNQMRFQNSTKHTTTVVLSTSLYYFKLQNKSPQAN